MAETTATVLKGDLVTKRKVALGIWAIFVTQFVSYLFINARNIAQPQIIAELRGMALFSWRGVRNDHFFYIGLQHP